MGTLDETRVKRTQRDYTMGFKLQVVAAVEKGDMTYKQAQTTYGIQGKSTVLTWLRKHGKMDWNQPVRMTMPKSPRAKETPARWTGINGKVMKGINYLAETGSKGISI